MHKCPNPEGQKLNTCVAQRTFANQPSCKEYILDTIEGGEKIKQREGKMFLTLAKKSWPRKRRGL